MRKNLLTLSLVLIGATLATSQPVEAGGLLKRIFAKSEPECCEPVCPSPECPVPEATCCEVPASESPSPEPGPTDCAPKPVAPPCCASISISRQTSVVVLDSHPSAVEVPSAAKSHPVVQNTLAVRSTDLQSPNVPPLNTPNVRQSSLVHIVHFR